MMRQRGNNSYCQQTLGNPNPGKKKENCMRSISSVRCKFCWWWQNTPDLATDPAPAPAAVCCWSGPGPGAAVGPLHTAALLHCSTAGGHSRWWPLPLQLQHTGLVTDAAIPSLIPRPVSLNTNPDCVPDSFTHAGVATVAWPGNWGLLTSTAENCKRDNTRAFYCHFILL